MRKKSKVYSAALAVVFFTFPSLIALAAKKPNILFIPVDDLKPLLGCYGTTQVKTPNIDQLAKRGTVFLNAQCQQAICGPTRASLMTGMYCDYTKVWDLKTKMRDQRPNILTIPQYFKQKGYVTTGLGKTYDPRCVDRQLDGPSWSIRYGSQRPIASEKTGLSQYHRPEVKAIVQRIRKEMREKNIKTKDAKKKYALAAGARPTVECMDVPDDAYIDGANTNAAIVLLKKLANDGKPFFLSVGYAKPHLPFVAPKKYWDMYDRSSIKVHPYRKMPKGAPQIGFQPGWEMRSYSGVPKKGSLPDAQQRELIHGYYACVSYVDAQIGRLLKTLDELKLRDNTIICLWGDHGWHLGDHDMWCKHSNFEQAVRSPLIIAAPLAKANGGKAKAPVGFVDIFPTLCELSGLAIPKQLQGKSLVPILNDASANVKSGEMSQYPRGKRTMGYTYRTVRYRYTLWYTRKDGKLGEIVAKELYDYQKDPLEKENWVDKPEMAGMVKTLDRELKAMIAAARQESK